ncbi:hypothetical protein [Hymenobacter mucosus]|uniref:Uncharacterized protein n=1 Tax=Hymenobacter mucosus TaxID=1411120 RepID=A0A239AVF1_9BACT|nr:hypothetical protein [Hymenobacter mucosus]SNR98943.1 hypothetical protein SAMN06269173_11536 [Hymenobacter mucosus]
MKMAFIVVLTLFLLVALSCFAWRRIKGKSKPVDLVAKSNHQSVWSFHYGPATILPPREPAAQPPPPAADGNVLAKLMPDEDLRVKEDQARAAAAARAEALQNADSERAQQPAKQPDEPQTTLEKAAPTAPLKSSRHTPGAKVNVLELLGTDKATAAEQPVTTTTEEALAATAEATVSQALYSNPLTEATRTKNDEANRKAAVELKRRNRAALRTGTDGQKAALTALIKEGTAPD